MLRAELAQYIDHTLLKPECTAADVAALAAQAGELGTFSICVSPPQLPVTTPVGVAVATVAGFPSGAVTPEIKAAEAAGADFVKTSTGFHPAGGASEHAVALMRTTVGDRLGVKASGGIRTRQAAEAMIAAGTSRLGLSEPRTILGRPD